MRTFTLRGCVALIIVAISMVMIAPAAHAATSNPVVHGVQTELRRLGIRVTVDGVEGPETRQGACAARRLIGYAPASRSSVTQTDLNKLRATASLPKPTLGSSYLSVDQTCQMVYQALNGRWSRVMKASTGKAGSRTPNGNFKVYRKWAGGHISSETPNATQNNMFDTMYFIPGREIAIHGSNSVPSYPASGGCARISRADAAAIFGSVPIGTPVHVYGTP